MFVAIIHGVLLAFPLIMPLGPQNVFIFNQGASQKNFSKVLPIVITAALCDTLLITLAVTGVSVLIMSSLIIKSILIVFGTIFLSYMGWVTWSSKTVTSNNTETASTVETVSTKQKIVFAISASLLNPHAIMDTVGVIGISALKYTGANKLAFTLATIAVSWIWFYSLALLGRFVGKLDNTGKIGGIINKISAIFMWVAAIVLLVSLRG